MVAVSLALVACHTSRETATTTESARDTAAVDSLSVEKEAEKTFFEIWKLRADSIIFDFDSLFIPLRLQTGGTEVKGDSTELVAGVVIKGGHIGYHGLDAEGNDESQEVERENIDFSHAQKGYVEENAKKEEKKTTTAVYKPNWLATLIVALFFAFFVAFAIHLYRFAKRQ